MNKNERILKIIVDAINLLGHGEFSLLDPLLDNLKKTSMEFDDKIQEDVLDFIQQIEFQKDYDPAHLVTKEIQQTADRLITDLKC